jgi:hypothetical protein
MAGSDKRVDVKRKSGWWQWEVGAKLIFVNKKYLIDIRKDRGSYCRAYLDREAKSSFVF